MWTPDVYEGAATPITAFMAAAVKAAAFAAFLRVWIEAFPGATTRGCIRCSGSRSITMIGGNVIALQQKNMKRMLAYSSIAHAGYSARRRSSSRNALGASAFLFYLVAYTLATMGAFAVVIALGEPGERNQEIADYAGLWYVQPWLASAMAVFMLALLGFPVAGGMGFFAKWYVIDAALHAPHPQTVLAVILVLASVISCGYYLGVVLVMFMKPRAADALVGAAGADGNVSRHLSLRVHAAALRHSPERLRDARAGQRTDQHGGCTGRTSGDGRGQSMITRGRPRGLALYRGTR